MLIDHIGFTFYDNYTEAYLLRIIGRIAMPIYAYGIANGYIHTSDKQKYIKRIAILALISQVPYTLLGSTNLNICFTWFFSLLILYGTDIFLKKKSFQILLIALFLSIFSYRIIGYDYGFYGIAFVLLFYYRNLQPNKKRNTRLFIGIFLILTVHWLMDKTVWNAIQFFELLSLIIILYCEKKNLTRINNCAIKKIYYWFYPTHMMILFAIACLT